LDKFIVRGGTRLCGEVRISGAKNAAVAIIPAAILSDGICRLENIPAISDVTNSLIILKEMGADVKRIDANTIEIDPRNISSYIVPHEMANRMRASYYLIGALLGTYFLKKISPVWLKRIFGGFMVYAGVRLLLK